MKSIRHPWAPRRARLVGRATVVLRSLALGLAVLWLPLEAFAVGSVTHPTGAAQTDIAQGTIAQGTIADEESVEPGAGSERGAQSEGLAILTVLQARHAVPSREELEVLVPNAEAELITVASDVRASGWARQRAISLLSAYESAAAMSALGRLTHSEDPDVRAMSLYTLARTFPDVGPELLVLRLELVARTDAEERVVEYAIRGLRWIDVPAADAALARLAIDGPNVDLATSVRERRQARLSAPSGTPLGE